MAARSSSTAPAADPLSSQHQPTGMSSSLPESTSATTRIRTSNDTDKSQQQRASIAEGTPTLSKTETVLCGASAGVVSRFVIAPLDVVKIRLQMQTQRKDLSTLLRRKEAIEAAAGSASRQPRYKGMFSGMALIVREEGIRGLWKGNMAAEYLYLTYSGIQFLVYQQTKVFLKKSADVSAQKAAAIKFMGSSSTTAPTTGAVVAAPLSAFSTVAGSSAVQSFIAGANAGIIATACTYPFDLLRTRFAIQRDVKVYTGIIQACRHIYTADGVQGFYRGMAPALIQVIPYMGIMFGSYDTLKHLASWLKKKAGVESSYSKRTITASSGSGTAPPDKELPVKTVGQFLLGLEDFLCGALSGVISKTGVYPLDMVRKRLQIQGSEQQKSMTTSSVSGTASGSKSVADKLPTTVWRCMVHIAQREGYLALYKGLLPGLLKAAPSSITNLPPEVLELIANFLEKTEIPQVIRTSRHFHQHFAFRLWRVASLRSGLLSFDADNLRAHAQWVQTIEYWGILPSQYYDVIFPNLRILRRVERRPLYSNELSPIAERDANWARLVRLNPTIQDITVYMADYREFDLREFWRAVEATLMDPRRLKMGGNGLRLTTGEGAELFWRAARRFHEIDYHGEDFLDVFPRLALDCSRVYHLTYGSRNLTNLGLEKHLELFKSCRNLKKLHWKVNTNTFPLDDLSLLVEQEVWLDLEDLYARANGASDERLATVMGRLPPLKRFGLGSGNFGPLCFDQLRRRFFGSLRSLDLAGCHSFTSPMALEVLMNCRHLEQFKAAIIALKDLPPNSQPWACERLRHLTVYYARDGDDSGLDTLFFEHLSRLRYLETIDVSRKKPFWNSAGHMIVWQTPQWKLASGLAQLATLKNLRSLNFESTKQDLWREDVAGGCGVDGW
ncbi:mitochondrial thiamine pyrophosphate transporter [Mortierella sp. 14UC]|nr:mitochondrial thiamine pyrophosphate transporter [Mortierella sp. 14UC]